MAIRLLVDRVSNLQAVISTRSLRIVSPQFRAATVTVARPSYAATIAYPLYQVAVNYRHLNSSTFYRALKTAELILDADTKNRYFRDLEQVAFVDTTVFDLAKQLSPDVIYTLDVAVKLIAKTTEPSSIDFAEYLQFLITFNRSFEELLSVADATVLDTIKALFDYPVITDAIDAKNFEKVLLQEVLLGDSQLSLSYLTNKADSTELSDQFNKEVQYNRPQQDFLNQSVDYASFHFDSGTKAESLGIVDARFVNSSKPLSDAISVSESSALLVSKPILEEVFTSDSFDRVVQFERLFTDTFVLDDNATVGGFIKDTYTTKTNVVGFEDVYSFLLTKTFDDTVVTSDVSSLETAKALSDTFPVYDVLTLSKRSRASSVLNVGALNSAPINN